MEYYTVYCINNRMPTAATPPARGINVRHNARVFNPIDFRAGHSGDTGPGVTSQ